MKKSLLKIALSVLLVAVVLVGGTLAYLVTQTNILTNTFAVVDITTTIEESPDSDLAEDKEPEVKNQSNVPVYVRAIAVATTEEGSSVPVSAEDVTINYAGAGWVPYGDYYYYTEPLPANGETTALFNGVTVNIPEKDAEGAKFAVYVYHESVEAKEFNWGADTEPEEKAADIARLFN